METEGVDGSAIGHVDLFRLIDLLRQRVVIVHVDGKTIVAISAFPNGRIVHYSIRCDAQFDVGTITMSINVSIPSGEIVGVRVGIITGLINDTVVLIGIVKIAIRVPGGVLVHGHHQITGAVVFERYIQGNGVPAFREGKVPFIDNIGGAHGFKIGIAGKSAPRYLFHIESDVVGLWRGGLHIETDALDRAASRQPYLLSSIDLLYKGIGIAALIGTAGSGVYARTDSNLLAVRCDVEPDVGAIRIKVSTATPTGKGIEVGPLAVAVPGNCPVTGSSRGIKGERSTWISADGIEQTDEQVATVILERLVKGEGEPATARCRQVAVIHHVVEADGHHVGGGLKRAFGGVHQKHLDVAQIETAGMGIVETDGGDGASDRHPDLFRCINLLCQGVMKIHI